MLKSDGTFELCWEFGRDNIVQVNKGIYVLRY